MQQRHHGILIQDNLRKGQQLQKIPADTAKGCLHPLLYSNFYQAEPSLATNTEILGTLLNICGSSQAACEQIRHKLIVVMAQGIFVLPVPLGVDRQNLCQHGEQLQQAV